MHYTLIVVTTANSLHHYKVIIDQVKLAVPEKQTCTVCKPVIVK